MPSSIKAFPRWVAVNEVRVVLDQRFECLEIFRKRGPSILALFESFIQFFDDLVVVLAVPEDATIFEDVSFVLAIALKFDRL